MYNYILLYAFIGNCSNQEQLINIGISDVHGQNAVVYQFRIELSCSSSCHCVVPQGTFGFVQEWNDGNVFCNSSVSSPYHLCASNSQDTLYVTKAFHIFDGAEYYDGEDEYCDHHSDEETSDSTMFCPEGGSVLPSFSSSSCVIESSISHTLPMSTNQLSLITEFTKSQQLSHPSTTEIYHSSLATLSLSASSTIQQAHTSLDSNSLLSTTTSLLSIQITPSFSSLPMSTYQLLLTTQSTESVTIQQFLPTSTTEIYHSSSAALSLSASSTMKQAQTTLDSKSASLVLSTTYLMSIQITPSFSQSESLTPTPSTVFCPAQENWDQTLACGVHQAIISCNG